MLGGQRVHSLVRGGLVVVFETRSRGHEQGIHRWSMCLCLRVDISSNTGRIREMVSQPTSKISKSEADSAELESSERRLRFPKDAASLMQEQVQSQGLHVIERQAACVAAKVAWTAAESTVLSLTASK